MTAKRGLLLIVAFMPALSLPGPRAVNGRTASSESRIESPSSAQDEVQNIHILSE
jgi:hypothetical protein